MSDSPEKTDSSEVSTQQTLAANQVAASLNSHIPERHRNWHWNWMLIGCTALITVAGLVFSSVSYLHHSNQAAKSFLTLASEAADRGEIDTQINWRNRYSLMNPDNHEIIIETAIIADNAVEKAARGDRFAAIRTAQKQLSNSIARLDSQKYGSAIDDLRKRLVERLLQLGGFRLKEAESQILKMRANPNDAFVAKQFARAIVGQVLNGIYEPRDPLMKDKETDYWGWMRNQVPGEILTLAVRRNPKDIDLISLFLTAYHDHPQIFEPLDQRDGTDELATLADQLVEEAVTFLLENASSQSNWILYTYYSAENLQEPARNLARKNVKASLDRIAEASVSEKENTKPVSSLVPEYFWDIYLVNAAAMSLESEDSQKTIEYYSFLTKLQLEPLPTQAIEISYLRLGSAYLNNQDTEAALESWQKGLIENPNSIPILNAIATFKVAERNDVEAAKEALDALQSAINSRVQFIASKSPAELPDDQRSIAVDKNQVARWQYEVLQASLDQQEGRETEAIERLQRALGTTLKINTPYLVAVANQLADIYAAKNLWDQVATSLDRVSDKDPNNAFLRARIANAWQKAGNLEQANKQWRTIKSEDSLNFRIAAVEAAINQQTQLPPTLRDFRQARAVLSTLRSELEASTAEAPEDNNGEFIETRTRNQAYLDVLAAFIPSVGADIENHLNSGDFVANVIELSERYTDDRDIQIFAAKRLASADRLAESKSALTRLEKIEGPDSTLVEVTKSQIESLQGEWDQAAERLLKQAETDSGRATNLTLRAASYLERGGELEKAYSCLANLPSDSQTIEALARLALLANSIPDNSSILVSLELENPRRVLAENWEKKTRDLEGEKGTTWRMLKIRRLIGELRSARDRIESTDIRLREAKKTQSRDPQLASSLG
ncbi:hypothetical protein OAE79_00425 [Rhodopirellula sp.]|nr:hypothetical protein [Rhodopirellula sp.]MDB4678775.1 hypothetical protein [Rhodopirellula sp.]